MKAAICRYDGKTFTVFTKNEHQAEVKPGVYVEQTGSYLDYPINGFNSSFQSHSTYSSGTITF